LPPGPEPAMNSVEKRLKATVNRDSDRFFDSQPLNLAPQGVFVYPQFAGCDDLSPPVALQGCLDGTLLERPESGV
jgi:hypothetical protein